jgi:predicted ATPase/DNA-binding winged helix-turn-helix (wHTH) protein
MADPADASAGDALALTACVVDLERRRVTRADGQRESLTEQELGLLLYLAERPGRTVPREELLQQVWGYSPRVVSRAIDVAVRRLRQKIEADPAQPRHLVAVRGVGYRFEPTGAAEPAVPGPPGAALRLPHERSSFVGREEALARVRDALDQERLVTITGPPGAGKSRLALRIGNEQRLAGGSAVWVPLSAARGGSELVRAVARALGVAVEPGHGDEGAAQQVAVALRARRDPLLFLDDGDHLVEALAGAVSGWLDAVGGLRIVVTSRERLRVHGEIVVALGAMARDDATRLFLERARAVRPGWGDAEDDTVAAIAAELDDNPLAIELAAARAEVMPPAAVLRGLDERFRLLGTGRRDAGERQASLYRAIDWSWSLLDAVGQRVLAQCAVFDDGFSAAAAEGVLDLAGREGDTEEWALDRVQDLVSRSLLQVRTPSAGQVRFQLAGSIRAFAASRAAELGLAQGASSRHGAHFLEVAQGWREVRPDRLLLDAGNLEAARRTALGRGAVDDAAQLALALDAAYEGFGPLAERLRVLTEVLEAGPTPAREVALRLARGRAAGLAGQPGWRADVERALGLAASLQAADAGLLAEALLAKAELTNFSRGDPAVVWEAAERSMALARAAGDLRCEANALTVLALVEPRPEHVARLDEMLRQVPDPAVRVEALHVLAFVAAASGRRGQAVERCREAVAVAVGMGDRKREAVLRGSLGAILARGGEAAGALEEMQLAAEGLRESGVVSAFTFANAALLALGLGRLELCRELGRRGLDEAMAGGGGAAWSPRGILGMLDVVEGAPGSGREALERALDEIDPSPQWTLTVGRLAAWAAVACAETGDLEAAEGWLAAAGPRLQEGVGLGLLRVAEGAVALGRGDRVGAERCAEAAAEIVRGAGAAGPALEAMLPGSVEVAVAHLRGRIPRD